MPSDLIVKTGDQAMFNPTFGAATVVVVPGTITGSGKGQVDGGIFCVERMRRRSRSRGSPTWRPRT